MPRIGKKKKSVDNEVTKQYRKAEKHKGGKRHTVKEHRNYM